MYCIVSSLARGKLDGISTKQPPPNISSSDVVPITDHSNKQVCRYKKRDNKGSLLDSILTDNVTESESEDSGCETLDNLSRKAQKSQEDNNVLVNSTTAADIFHGNHSLGIRKRKLNSCTTNDLGTSTTTDSPSSSPLSCKHSVVRNKGGVVDKLNG